MLWALPRADPPDPQGQFLCLAVLKGRLVLLYDFGAGLQEANRTHPPPSLTTASKAVRLKPGGSAGSPWGKAGWAGRWEHHRP